jgi:hypothetical protein
MPKPPIMEILREIEILIDRHGYRIWKIISGEKGTTLRIVPKKNDDNNEEPLTKHELHGSG